MDSTVSGNPERRSGNFHPSVWRDFFLAYETVEIFPEEVKLDLEQLKEEITMKLRKTCEEESSLTKLEMIDSIQRLGISYHFEVEIKTSMWNVYNKLNLDDYETQEEEKENLHTVALRFRLLREQGHRVSCDMLKKFLNKEGEFDESLTSDVVGMLSLYEASHYRVHGEKILDEALSFTTTALKCCLFARRNNDDSSSTADFIANQISHALDWPIRKTINRVASRLFISLYQQDQSHDKVLLKLAKLDFNAVQRMHQQELCALTKWWKKVDYDAKYSFGRDKLVENYYISMGLYFEPQYSLGREILTKVEYLLTIMDDIYDTYGTIDELLLFTDATESWNLDTINHLPLYMKHFYEAFYDVFIEIEAELAKNDRSVQVKYVKENVKEMAKAYYKEAYWYHNKYQPTPEEYMDTACCSMSVGLMATNSFLGMENVVTEEILNWSMCEPLIIRAASTIGRLMNDLHAKTAGDNATTAVKCYMNQFGVSRKTAVDEIRKQITDAWKDLNNECLFPTSVVPLIVTERVVNLAKMMYTLFAERDGFTHSDSLTKKLITLVFVDPVV